MTTTIRVLESTDAAEYRVLFLGALQEAPTAFVTSYAEVKDSPLSTFEQLLSGSKAADRHTVGAFSPGGELIGSIAAQRAGQRQLAHKASLYRLYVAPGWRRRGIGRLLLHPARSLYRAAGFAPYAREPEAVRVDGVYYALESLRMVLSDGC